MQKQLRSLWAMRNFRAISPQQNTSDQFKEIVQGLQLVCVNVKYEYWCGFELHELTYMVDSSVMGSYVNLCDYRLVQQCIFVHLPTCMMKQEGNAWL